MKTVPSPFKKNSDNAYIAKKWLSASLTNKPALWAALAALIPPGYCLHGVKKGKLLFSKVEKEPRWPSNC